MSWCCFVAGSPLKNIVSIKEVTYLNGGKIKQNLLDFADLVRHFSVSRYSNFSPYALQMKPRNKIVMCHIDSSALFWRKECMRTVQMKLFRFEMEIAAQQNIQGENSKECAITTSYSRLLHFACIMLEV